MKLITYLRAHEQARWSYYVSKIDTPKYYKYMRQMYRLRDGLIRRMDSMEKQYNILLNYAEMKLEEEEAQR